MTRLSAPLRKLLDSPETHRRVGPFQLIRQLGRGGSAPVWLAREMYGGTELRLAAVKLFSLDGDKATGGSMFSKTATMGRDRIAREARALCQLEHENIVRFFSIAVEETSGLLAVAMEYLTGASLDDTLGQGEPLALERTLHLGISISSALHAVHQAGLLHRDIKPHNIIDSNGTYKLIDFGISTAEEDDRAAAVHAALLDDLPLELTDAQKKDLGALTIERGTSTISSSFHTSGTVGYFDPVCVGKKQPPTRASDLYALGVVLFECATGRHPATVAAHEGGGLSTEILDGRVRSPSVGSVAKGLPPAFVRLVDAMLSPDPAQRPRSAEWIGIELERVRDDLAGRARNLPPEEVGPFRGLGRFEPSDRGVYFGRAREIAAGLELLRGHGVVTLVGLSGSGKSSLARAGIAPRVAEGALGRWPSEWDVATMSPGVDARRSLLEALAELSNPPKVRSDQQPDEVAAALAEHAQQEGRGVLLLVDQLEELVTTSSEEARAFVARVLQCIGEASPPGVRALCTVRSDLLEAVLRSGGAMATTLVRGSLVVEPMSDASWGEVVVQALDAYGYKLEDEALHDELVRDLAGTAGAMPLVAFALTELWQRRDVANKRIPREALRALGGISGALERHADAAVHHLVANGAGALEVRALLLSLTTPQGTRASRPLRDVANEHPSYARIVDELERSRLLVRGEEVTLAHEALLTHWGRLRHWVSEVRDDRVLAEELDREGVRYRRAPDEAPLLKQRRLAMALDLEQRGHVPVSDAARSFIAQSRRAARRARVWMGVAAVIGVGLASSAAIASVRAARESERAALAQAGLEKQKVEDEQARRVEVEAKQAELNRQQSRIDELLAQLSDAPDPEEVKKLMDQIDAAQEDARTTQATIQSSLAAAPPPPPKPAAETSTGTGTGTGGPKIKPQYEDD